MAEVSAATVRKALLGDVAQLVELINGYASQGIMLPRTEFELAENIRDFTVAVEGDRVAGGGALHFYGTRIGEVRSLAVHPDWKGHGVGRRLVEALAEEGVAHGLRSLFAFTYVPSFFARLGFVEVDRRLLPSKVWKDCLRCPKLQCCDEIAMRRQLAAVEEEGVLEEQPNGFVVFPTLSPAVRSR